MLSPRNVTHALTNQSGKIILGAGSDKKTVYFSGHHGDIGHCISNPPQLYDMFYLFMCFPPLCRLLILPSLLLWPFSLPPLPSFACCFWPAESFFSYWNVKGHGLGVEISLVADMKTPNKNTSAFKLAPRLRIAVNIGARHLENSVYGKVWLQQWWIQAVKVWENSYAIPSASCWTHKSCVTQWQMMSM